MLRFFTNELDKPQSVLAVIGFSFQDKHIAKMVKRASANPELLIICFCYSSGDVKTILKNLQFELNEQIPKNIQFVVPGKEKKQLIDDNKLKYNVQFINCEQITLDNVVNFMNGAYDEKDDE